MAVRYTSISVINIEGTYDALQSLPRDYMDSSKFATIVPLFTFHPSYFSKERFAFREGILKYSNTSSMIHRAKELLPKTKEELIREIKENHFVRCGEVAQNHVQYSRLFFLSNIFLPSGTI